MAKRAFLTGVVSALFLGVINCSNAGVLGDAGQNVDDAAITAKVKAQFVRDRGLSASSINVSTTHGVVYLTGNVDTNQQFERAVTLAESSTGVTDVQADHLKVKGSAQPLSDTYITAKVQGILLKNSITDSDRAKIMGLHVETLNGVVHVSGNVSTDTMKQNIIRLIKSVKGVRDVKEDLNVLKN